MIKKGPVGTVSPPGAECGESAPASVPPGELQQLKVEAGYTDVSIAPRAHRMVPGTEHSEWLSLALSSMSVGFHLAAQV